MKDTQNFTTRLCKPRTISSAFSEPLPWVQHPAGTCPWPPRGESVEGSPRPSPRRVLIPRQRLTSLPPARCAQDEIEIGYIQAPHKVMPVVFDSPRNRGLKEFPVKCLLVGAGGAPATETPALRPPSSLPVSSHPFSG